jgi:hypothetical protein
MVRGLILKVFLTLKSNRKSNKKIKSIKNIVRMRKKCGEKA